jgi:gluconolactonase
MRGASGAASVLERFRQIGERLNHPEGVAWNPFDGYIYAGGEGGEFYRVSQDGNVELLGSTGGWMLGLAVDGDGRVYACDHGNGNIARIDPVTRAIDTYGTGREEPLDTPNVAVFDSHGNLYVTCSGENGCPEIVRIIPSGTIETWTTSVPGYPNGCVVLPDNRAMLVVEAKAERVARIPILPNGFAGPPETFVALPHTDADGLALDVEGFLWVTLFRPDGLLRVTPDGKIAARIDDDLATTLNAPTNIAFSGEDLRLAVVANVGGRRLLAADLGVSGQPLHYPKVEQ